MSRLLHAAGAVSAATMVSRVFGLLRDSVRSAVLGAKHLSDAVDLAFKVPNLLRDLFAEGAFSGALVPTLTRERERGGTEAMFLLMNRVLCTLLVYVGGLVLLMVLFAEPIVHVIADPSFVADPDRAGPAVRLVKVLSPFLLFISLAVVAMGALNVCGRFFVPALSPAVQNVALVLGGSGLLIFGIVEDAAALPWALLLLAGGALQFLIQIPALRREGWRFRPVSDLRLRTGPVREILRRMAPVMLGMAAVQLSILINMKLATSEVGAPSYLYYGFRPMHLPVGLVGVAIGTAVLAQASRAVAQGEASALRRSLQDSLRLTIAFALPAAVGLAVLGVPIARLLFRYGATSPMEAELIGIAVQIFGLAVVFFCCVKVVVPVCYAAGRIRLPVLASVAAVGANVACALALHPLWGWPALPLALAVGQATNLAVLLWGTREWTGRLGRKGWTFLGKVGLASAACGGAAAASRILLPDGGSFLARLAGGLGPVLVGAAAYFAVGSLVGCSEVRSVGALFRGRGRRTRRP